MMLRLFYLLSITILALLLPWWLLLLFVIPYLYFYTAYELVVVMILIDGYFGVLGEMPVLSMMIGGLCIMIESIKPYVSLRTSDL